MALHRADIRGRSGYHHAVPWFRDISLTGNPHQERMEILPMRIKNMLALLVVGAVVALMASNVSFAEDDAAPAAPAAKKAPAEAKVAAEGDKPCCSDCKDCDCEKAKAAFDNPMMVMMVWVAKKVVPEGTSMCPSTEDGEKAWRNWFDGGKDVPLAELRDHMVKMGWNADKTVGWFQAMAKGKAKDCGSCAKGAAAATPAETKAVGGAAGVAGDAGPEGKSSECGGCCKGKCGGCDKAKGDCNGCKDKAKGECCGGCDKAKKAKEETPAKVG